MLHPVAPASLLPFVWSVRTAKRPQKRPIRALWPGDPLRRRFWDHTPIWPQKCPVAISAGLSLFKSGVHLAPFEILCIFRFWNKEKAPLMVPSFLPFLPSPLTPIYSIFSFSPLLSPQKKVCKTRAREEKFFEAVL